ncbi:factor associated with metabolism and energy [Hyperolius riggenbachi]|uniref:factor associated with metabolism and energy n=1 Tax=Hyperolius riggenbachi TaxID=752182 RepID=UPI0035A3AE2A
MGLNSSKLNHKVRKVAPLDNKDVFVSPAINGLNTYSDYGRMDNGSPMYERQLPPLRETLYGRGPIVPRPTSFDVPLDNGGTNSIIKKHPPRRLQKLEPAVLPTLLSAERVISKQEAAAARREKELEKKAGMSKNSGVRRQQLHKMQMQELNRRLEEMNRLQSQAEIKRNNRRESKINKQRVKEIRAKKVRENVMRCHEDEDFLPLEHDETFNMHHGNTWHWNTRDIASTPDCQLGKNKLNLWFESRRQGAEPSYSSSSDSLDSWIREDARSHRRPPLVRTHTEKIPTFDEFYDQDF